MEGGVPMKKFTAMSVLFFSIICVSLSAAENKAAQKSSAGGFDPGRPNKMADTLKAIGRYALLYIPNRLIDVTDIFTIEAGFGGVVAGEFYATRYMQFGGSHGVSYFLTKGYSRQYGGGYRDDSRFGLFCWATEVSFVEDTFGTVREYVIDSPQFSIADYRLDAYRDDDVDFWAIGGRFGWLFDIGVGIHPVEIADMITGFFFFDLKGDDLK
jgi:hypothetical protein